MGKRSNREGSAPVQLKDGRWQARMTVEGKRKAFYGSTREEAHDKLIAAQADLRRGLPIVAEKLTVGKYLQGWLEASKLTSRRYSTWKRKDELIRLHVIPTLGKVALAKLTPQQVQRLYAKLKEGSLSLSTVHRVHNTLHMAIKQAVREGAVVRNVTELLDGPSDEYRALVVLHDAQIRVFIEAAMGDKWEALWLLGITTGMRAGEMLALTWHSLDLDHSSLAVVASMRPNEAGQWVPVPPQTASGKRTIVLRPEVCESLRRHRARQLEVRLGAGAAWAEQDLVFPNGLGRAMDEIGLYRRQFKPLLKRAGLPSIRLHDLRHSAATWLISQGMAIKAVSEMLGHADVGTTLRWYGHVSPTMQAQIVAVWDQLFATEERGHANG